MSDSAEWRPLDLAIEDAAAGVWAGRLPGPGTATVEFIAQAVDMAGNVAWFDDYGSPFVFSGSAIYLPVIVRQ